MTYTIRIQLGIRTVVNGGPGGRAHQFRDVRFTPKSGHVQCNSAMSALCQ